MGREHKDANTPVLILHGGTANVCDILSSVFFPPNVIAQSNWMWLQAQALVKDHYVVSIEYAPSDRGRVKA
ncbi:hypothetical protein BDZ89DRAFT_1058174 [Hymenopellis radicata]|nr:hypothetical protein BDZ89DRAFT_1058174 [Hymenopellis radicata]